MQCNSIKKEGHKSTLASTHQTGCFPHLISDTLRHSLASTPSSTISWSLASASPPIPSPAATTPGRGASQNRTDPESVPPASRRPFSGCGQARCRTGLGAYEQRCLTDGTAIMLHGAGSVFDRHLLYNGRKSALTLISLIRSQSPVALSLSQI